MARIYFFYDLSVTCWVKFRMYGEYCTFFILCFAKKRKNTDEKAFISDTDASKHCDIITSLYKLINWEHEFI